ncbi:L-ascorbate metabolism protein UlaG (beta-lactamase superfamily) [Actinoplanes lutulentus]|uniref:L-ascorbate metabolism protein UlaG (Beta-lactamase superfamily) n=1 Tax=Actinoplanes lutulentus TaxID=1287878 RepID=A0A327YY38_9ACTN|nr:MBL fold metallo-hydrolase [Actinoplanes lutulentus]MBB2948973.1 L-ascorbate metabolism protein UlaG (beta-lactamase superfamily) [Actinoplanes lutulentus]RAK26244.1 L-ascorbate metabolism protein UlaG (beta-lactamase superfamily) [Actinoplanes lutulentus]
MRLIKFTHACVRLEDGDRRLLIDPGVWTEPEAFDGVTDILVTHEHEDHLDLARIDGSLRLFAPDSVRELAAEHGLAETVTVVAAGDEFSAGGFPVTAVGGKHAEIYDGLPGCANLGYVVEGIYHPGDSYFVPDQRVTTLLVPAAAPWGRHREAIEMTRAIAPDRAFPIHDRALSTDVGYGNFDAWLGSKGGTEYSRIPVGGSVTF